MNNFKFDCCRAKLVSCGSLDAVNEAWKTSRPYDLTPDWEKVYSMDVPVNEFLPLHFELKAPILIREIICSYRNHVVWARSSRVDNLEEWELWVDTPMNVIEECGALHQLMSKEMNEEHQDDFRRHLPIGYMTTFSFMMSFRDLVKFITSLKNENNRLFDDAASALLFAVEKGDPTLSRLLELALTKSYYKTSKFFPHPVNSAVNAAFGDYISSTKSISLQLRAQLIRHRALTVKDSLRDYFSLEKLSSPMTSTVDAQIIFPMDFAEDLIRKRSCWIAQTDLWYPIVRSLKDIISKDKVLLPCDDGKCRFIRDNDMRKSGRDPSPPCPLIAKMEGERLDADQKTAAAEYAGRRPDFDFWKKVINNA